MAKETDPDKIRQINLDIERLTRQVGSLHTALNDAADERPQNRVKIGRLTSELQGKVAELNLLRERL